MYHIPYGTVLELRKLGLEEKEDEYTGRKLPHLTLSGKREYAIINNGMVNNRTWVFLEAKTPRQSSFDFSRDNLPITAFIKETTYGTVKNNKGDTISRLTISDIILLKKIVHAFYLGACECFILKDKRVEALQSRVDSLEKVKQTLFEEYEQRIDSLQMEIKGLKSQQFDTEKNTNHDNIHRKKNT